MIVVWDEPKRVANLSKHGIDFADIGEAYFLDAVIRPARTPRFKAIGRFGDGAISVVFRPLGEEGLSIVSARPANASERNLLR